MSAAIAQWITSCCGCVGNWGRWARRSRRSGASATGCGARAEGRHDTRNGHARHRKPDKLDMLDGHLDLEASHTRDSPDSSTLARALAQILVQRQSPAGVGRDAADPDADA